MIGRFRVAAAFAAVALWSTNALAAKLALVELGVVQVLALQFGGATAALAALRAARSARTGGTGETVQCPSLRLPYVLGGMAVGVVGLTGTISLQYLAFATAPIVEANVLAYGWPLFAAIWAAVAYRTRRTLTGVPLAMVGFAGVALILGFGSGFEATGGGTAGYAAALASAACMTLYTVASGRSRVPANASLLLASTLGMVFVLVLCAAGTAPWVWSGAGAWAASVYAGVGPMAGGFLLWSVAMSGDGAKTLAPLGYATPLLSTALLLLFGETLAPGALLGSALVLVSSIGVLIMNRKVRG
jgi:drug/metabolite transporter (DMT)-like permease